MASEQADWRKFKRWLRRHLSKVEGNDFDFDKDALEKHADLDICLGDFDKKGVVNTDMAIFKWNNSIFMTEEEIKKTPEDKRAKPLTPVHQFDLSKAERVIVNKSDLKVQEIQAEQEKLS